jgi:hypothetical protein
MNRIIPNCYRTPSGCRARKSILYTPRGNVRLQKTFYHQGGQLLRLCQSCLDTVPLRLCGAPAVAAAQRHVHQKLTQRHATRSQCHGRREQNLRRAYAPRQTEYRRYNKQQQNSTHPFSGDVARNGAEGVHELGAKHDPWSRAAADSAVLLVRLQDVCMDLEQLNVTTSKVRHIRLLGQQQHNSSLPPAPPGAHRCRENSHFIQSTDVAITNEGVELAAHSPQ